MKRKIRNPVSGVKRGGQPSKTKLSILKNRISLIAIVLIIFLIIIVKDFTGSIFLQPKDNVNILFYGNNTRVFSLDKKGVDTVVSFSSNAMIPIPGGYGKYRIGALSKLANLEKDDAMYKRSFSSAVGAFVDIYFYPSKDEIYYNNNTANYFLPTFSEIFFDRSNANLVDRIMTFIYFLGKNANSFKLIKTGDGFSASEFNTDYQGLFYEKTFRDEGDNVQILYYQNYDTANLISQIIDGEGIRVVDISSGDNLPNKCLLITSQAKLRSKITLALKKFFDCDVKVGQTQVSDIILELGSLEKEWAPK